MSLTGIIGTRFTSTFSLLNIDSLGESLSLGAYAAIYL
jgi:hypothetical protein